MQQSEHFSDHARLLQLCPPSGDLPQRSIPNMTLGPTLRPSPAQTLLPIGQLNSRTQGRRSSHVWRLITFPFPVCYLYAFPFPSLIYSVIAASVDVERAFSAGGIFVSDRRHRLADKSIRAGLLVGSWTLVPGLVSQTEMMLFFKTKVSGSKRSRKGKGKGKERATSPEVIELD